MAFLLSSITLYVFQDLGDISFMTLAQAVYSCAMNIPVTIYQIVYSLVCLSIKLLKVRVCILGA